jgi:hypothetical protein
VGSAVVLYGAVVLAVGTQVVLLKHWQPKIPGFILPPGALGTIREVVGDEYVVEFYAATGRVKADMVEPVTGKEVSDD